MESSTLTNPMFHFPYKSFTSTFPFHQLLSQLVSNMKNSSFPSVFTFLSFFFLLLVSVRSDVIQDSCSKAAEGDRNIKVDLCVASLEANPKSKSATSTGDLVPIAIEIAISNAKGISSTVSKLLENKSLDPYIRSCLEDCSELYSEAGSSLQSAGQAVKSKDYGTANSVISAAMDDSSTCEDGFKEKKGVVSPLAKENSNFFLLTAISLAFMNMIQ